MRRGILYYGTLVQLSFCLSVGGCGVDDRKLDDWERLPPSVSLSEEQQLISQSDVALGRALFNSPALSLNGQVSCASCHPESQALQDGLQFSSGVTGETLLRNTPSLFNIGWAGYVTWSNLAFFELEQHMTVPLFGDTPPEMAARFDLEWLRTQLVRDPQVVEKLAEHPRFVTVDNLEWPAAMSLIAKYMRSLTSFDSAWDHSQNSGALLSSSALAGQALFFSDRLGCSSCHVPPFFSAAYRLGSETRPSVEAAFANTGLYFVGETKSGYPEGDPGLMEFTGLSKDGGRFRIPSLRNVEFTAPYMHDGSIPTLEEVVDHYAAGGRTIKDGPNKGEGSKHPNRDPRIQGFTITAQERQQLIDFLHSLSGDRVRQQIHGNSSRQ